MSDSPMDNIAYIVDEMRQVVENPMSAGREMSTEERDVEDFCKDMIKDFANRLGREHKRMGMAILDFCNAFTMVFPPNDPDCPALLAGAFLNFKEALGIETVSASEEGGAA